MAGRYRHKLNMLEPGSKMCVWIAVLLALGGTLHFVGWVDFAIVPLAAAGLLLVILTILIAVERHQDHMLYLDAKKDAPDIP